MSASNAEHTSLDGWTPAPGFVSQETTVDDPDAFLDGTDAEPVVTRPRALVARENATKSTGPRTLAGKARSSRNATRHGLTSRAVVLPTVESADDWAAHRDAIVASLTPMGALEAELAERVAVLTWRLRRATLAETAAIAGQLADAETDAVERARPRELEEPDDLDDGSFVETLATLREDAENLTARASHHRRIYCAGADTVLDPADVAVMVDDVVMRANEGVEALELVAPDWRTRRWTGRAELELTLVQVFGADDVRGASFAVMLHGDTARSRLADAEKRHARYVAERQVPAMRGALLERYESHLQRQLASTLAMLRGVRETFTSTG